MSTNDNPQHTFHDAGTGTSVTVPTGVETPEYTAAAATTGAKMYVLGVDDNIISLPQGLTGADAARLYEAASRMLPGMPADTTEIAVLLPTADAFHGLEISPSHNPA